VPGPVNSSDCPSTGTTGHSVVAARTGCPDSDPAVHFPSSQQSEGQLYYVDLVLVPHERTNDSQTCHKQSNLDLCSFSETHSGVPSDIQPCHIYGIYVPIVEVALWVCLSRLQEVEVTLTPVVRYHFVTLGWSTHRMFFHTMTLAGMT